jgi:thiol:disulfide interchange protein DsbD
MGITLVFATFTCTVPLVGALLTVTGQSGGLGTVTIGMAVFGLTMALPFVILSLVPTRIRAMPRSGEWMHVLKVFLGFVELAAALKFFSNVEYVLQWQVLPRELFLVLWGGIFFVAGIFLLGMFRLQGESQAAIGPGRMLGAMATVVFSFYCLFGALGYQLDYVMTTIAPPYRAATLSGGLAVGGGGTEVAKGHTIITDDHDAAVAQALSENKLVMVNFTGYL